MSGNIRHPLSPEPNLDDPLFPGKKKRLSSETWSTISGLPLLSQPRQEPRVFSVLRWVFILLALGTLGFVLLVLGQLIKDHMEGSGRSILNTSKII